MKPPRNEREFMASEQPAERCDIKFVGAMQPAPIPEPKRLTLWQRFINLFFINIRWVP